MKLPLLLLLLLLGTVAALHLGNDAPYLDSQELQADLSQDLKSSGEKEGELVLTEEAIQSQGEQVEASSCQDAFEDEKAMESDPGALDENFQCPREEDTVTILVSAGNKNGRYRLVKTPKTFADARNTCRNCYRGTLASIHNKQINRNIQISCNNFYGNVWIGGTVYARGGKESHREPETLMREKHRSPASCPPSTGDVNATECPQLH
ncbi:proteoglycan 3-like [Myotis daubentonii]|uniref:proteoglycan 3-like n=1 Tax=Myotis daubentonii TaxID=98922 RepID=UPI002872D454|nr:proteoglycan 3-like [Myotis daubentonii]